MKKTKSHKGLTKRFKFTNPQKGEAKIMRQSKGRGTKHLKTKQSNPRKRRIRSPKKLHISTNVKRALKLN